MNISPVHRHLAALGLLNPRAKRRIVLPADLVQEALRRRGDKRFTRKEQEVIIRAVADPEAVQWPPWWEVRGRQGSRNDRQ